MIPINNPQDFTVPASAGFTPDRLGVRRVQIEVDRVTNQWRASFTPCPATALVWGPVDAAEVSSPDLIAELLALPDSAEKVAALEAVQRIAADLVVVAAAVLAGRE